MHLTKTDIASRLTAKDFVNAYTVKDAVSRCFACGITVEVARRILNDYHNGNININ